MKMLIIFLVTVFVFLSCADPDKKDNASIEPNDTIEEANSIDFGFEFPMAIYPKGDVDWYKLEVTEQGYIEVLKRAVPDKLDVQVRFATYDEWATKNENFLSGFRKLPCAMPVYEPGNYYVMVADRWGTNYSEEQFSVKFNFIEEFDKFEPNNDAHSATIVEFDKEYQSAIFPKGDKDWFLIEVEQQGYITIRAKSIPDNLDLSAYVATFDEYASSPVNIVRSIRNVPMDVAITEPGQYYVVFADRWDAKASKELFTWTVGFIPEMDVYEPNNSFNDAAKIDLNDTIEIAIFPQGDKDFFKVFAENEGSLSIKARDYGNIDLVARLLRLDPEDSNKTIQVESKRSLPVKFEIPESEHYYFIEFSDHWDQKASPELFEVVFEFE